MGITATFQSDIAPLIPRNYGAKGDGVTDDTNAFVDMFAFAKSSLRNITITGGIAGFLLPNGLPIINWKCNITGDGNQLNSPSRIIVTNNNAHGLHIKPDGFTASLYEVNISKLCIIGPSHIAAKGIGTFVNPHNALTIASISKANPCVVTTDLPVSTIGLVSGNTVTVANVINAPVLVGDYIATVTGANTFTIPFNNTNDTILGIVFIAGSDMFVDSINLLDITCIGFNYSFAGYKYSNATIRNFGAESANFGMAIGGNCNNLAISASHLGVCYKVALVGWGSGAGLLLSPIEGGGSDGVIAAPKFAVFGNGSSLLIRGGNVEAIAGSSTYGSDVWAEWFNGSSAEIHNTQFLGSGAIPGGRFNAYAQGGMHNVRLNNAPGATPIAQIARQSSKYVIVKDNAAAAGVNAVKYYDDAGAFATPFATTAPLGLPAFHVNDEPTPSLSISGSRFWSLNPTGTNGHHKLMTCIETELNGVKTYANVEL